MTLLNGIDPEALARLAECVSRDPAQGALEFNVLTQWQGGARSSARTRPPRAGSNAHGFRIEADTSAELLGSDAAPNPQELLLAALNASMVVGFAAHATRAGVQIEALQIDTRGALDLRRYLGLDPWLSPGYAAVVQHIEVRCAAPRAVLQQVLDQVLATSPILASFGRALEVQTELVVLPPA